MRHRQAVFARVGWGVLLAVWLPCALGAAPATLPGPLELDDPIAPLAPVKPRSEAEQDHLDALAHFAAGRVAVQREDHATALREYQRAARLDPEADYVLREIVPLAFELNRPAIAVRYALLAMEKGPADPVAMRRLAAFLSEQGQNDRALALYEKAQAAAAAKKEPPSPTGVVSTMEMGRLYFLAEKYAKAAECFHQVMAAIDNPAQYGLDDAMQKALIGKGEVTFQLFAESYLEAGRFDEALATFEKANSYKDDKEVLALNRARVAFKRGDLPAAEQNLNEFLAANRGDAGLSPYRLLRDLLKAQNNEAALETRLEELRATNDKNIPVRYFLAEYYREQDKLDKAEPLYQEVLTLSGEVPPIEALQGLVTIYTKRKDAPALLAVLGKTAQRTGTLELLGDARTRLIDEADLVAAVLALAEKQRAEAADSLTFGSRMAMAELALATKNFEQADEWFNTALKVRPEKTPEPVLAWGLQQFLAERYDAAAAVFKRVIDEQLLPPGNPAAHYYLAGALEMTGKTDEGVAVARAGAAMRPDSARFASRAAWILYHARRFDAAEAEYLEVLKQFDDQYDSDETREVMRDARLVLSNLAVQRKDLPAAESWLEQVLDEFPGDIGALNDLGYLYADQNKRPERALRMTQEAVAAEPENAAYRDSLGWALYRLGRYDEAAVQLRKSVELSTDPDGVLFDHLGDVLTKAGDRKGAIEAYQKALAAFEKEQDSAQAEAVKEKLK